MSKSGDWYKALREDDPEGYKKLMDDKYARRVSQLNSDPTKFAQSKYSKQRAGALARGLAWDLTTTQVHKLIKETKFRQLSGRPLVMEISHADGPSLDRIDNNCGYTVKNVQVISQQINKSRLDMTVEDFVQMCCDVADYSRR